jgi:phosphoribosyltransferase, putative/phosphoglycerate mutase family protein
MDYGVWEGLQREVVKKRFPELYHKYEENPFYNYPEGGENPFDVQKRIERFWEKKILSLPNNANQLVVVTHKTAGRILLNNVIEGMGSSFRRKTMDNATVAKVNVKLGIAEVEYENNKVFLL